MRLGNFSGGCFLLPLDKGVIDPIFRNQFLMGAIQNRRDKDFRQLKKLIDEEGWFFLLLMGGVFFGLQWGDFFQKPHPQRKRKENEMQLYDVNRQIEELLARLESDPETGWYSDIMMTLRWYKVLPRWIKGDRPTKLKMSPLARFPCSSNLGMAWGESSDDSKLQMLANKQGIGDNIIAGNLSAVF